MVRPPHWIPAPSDVPPPGLRTITSLWTLAAVLCGLGVGALFVDVPLAQWAARDACPSFVEKLCALSETFAHGAGILLIVATIGVLDPPHRRTIPRILTASLGSVLVANVFKPILARTRPRHFDLQGEALDSFAGWFPMLGNTSWEQGFPSSHMATAAGLAIVLACLYPRGRWLFPALAALAGMQRVLAEAHFLSDILWGAAVGCVFAPLCVYGSRIAETFDRLELRLGPNAAADAPEPTPSAGVHQTPTLAPDRRNDAERAA